MISVSGEMRVAEAQDVMPAIARRQRGPAWALTLIAIVLIFGGMLAGCVLAALFDALGGTPKLKGAGPGVLGIAVGWGVFFIVGRGWVARRFRKRTAERGFPLRFGQKLTVTDEALMTETGALRKSAD